MIEIKDGTMYLDQVKRLIVEYDQFLGRDLSFQNIDAELKDLEEKYAGREGRLLAAVDESGRAVGCVAYHRLSNTRCEMKRLYVQPSCRGEHAGRRLAEHIIALAAEDGYQDMVLDTIEPLKHAIALYERLGFKRIDAYYHNPMDDVIYMEKVLSQAKQ